MISYLQEMDAPKYHNGYDDALGMSSPPRDEKDDARDSVCSHVIEKELVPKENLPQQQPTGNADDDMTEDDEQTTNDTTTRAAFEEADTIVKRSSGETSIFGPYSETAEHNEPASSLRNSVPKRYASTTSSNKSGKMYDDEDDEVEEEDEEVVNQIVEEDTFIEDEIVEEAVQPSGDVDGTVTSSTSSKKRKRAVVRQEVVSIAVPPAPAEEDVANEETEDEGESTRSESPTPASLKANAKSSTLPKGATRIASKSALKPTPKKTSKPKAKSTKATKVKATPVPATTSASRKRPTASATPANTKLNVAFSNSTTQDRPGTMQQFLALGAKKVEKVTSKSDVLVVGNGAILKTPKLLLAVALNLPIVRDEWVTKCAKAGKFVDKEDCMPKNTSDVEWEGILGEQQCDRQELFSGKHLIVTPALKKSYGKMWEDIQVLADVIGFESVTSTSARNANLSRDTIVIGKETEDLDLISLIEEDVTCYSKDLLSSSILRGDLKGIDDFIVKIKPQPGKQAAKRRKSAP